MLSFAHPILTGGFKLSQEYHRSHWGSEPQVWLKIKNRLKLPITILQILQYHSGRLDIDKLLFGVLVRVPTLFAYTARGYATKNLGFGRLQSWFAGAKTSSQCFSDIPPLPPSNM